MMNMQKILAELDRPITMTQIAQNAGISRNTLYNARKCPENSTLKTLRAIALAMGFELVLKLEPLEQES